MARGEQPLDFKFDTSAFENAMNKMDRGLQTFGNSGDKVSKNITKGFSNVIGNIAKIGIALKAVKGAMDQIPEVGKAFGIAKDVIMKNLLFPLRKELFPILQNILDWVRDNRAQFVKWGRVIANVFGTVVGMVERLISTGRKLIDNFIGFINTIFGDPIKNLEEFINILSFKFSVALNFIGNVINAIFTQLEPLFSVVGRTVETIIGALSEIVGSLFNMVDGGASIERIFNSVLSIVTGIANFISQIIKGLFEGLIPKFKELESPVKSIMDNVGIFLDSIGKIVGVLFTGESALKFWASAFETIGNVVGTVLVAGFNIISGVVDVITKGLDEIIKFFETFDPGKFLDDVGKGFGDFFSGVGNLFSGGEVTRVNDAILRPDGSIVQTAPNDTIIATKNPGALGGQGKTITISIGDIIIHSTAPVSREGAIDHGQKLLEILQDQLDRELIREGL